MQDAGPVIIHTCMKIVDYHGELSVRSIAPLVEWAMGRCTAFTVIARLDEIESAERILSPLMSDLIERRRTNVWPGTRSAQFVELFKFELSDRAKPFLLADLFPTVIAAELPGPDDGVPWPPVEDLSLLRSDGRPMLITITHEYDVYLKLSPDEFAALRSEVGGENLSTSSEDCLPDEQY